jgi:2Fe-2S ferredoxin
MATIIIQNLATELTAQTGQTVLQAAAANQQDWMQACGGKGRCTSCKMQLVAGSELLAGYTEAEVRMQTANRLPDGFRLACQSQLVNDGELVVRIPESSKLPHLPYTD